MKLIQDEEKLNQIMQGKTFQMFTDFEDENPTAGATLKAELLKMVRRGVFNEPIKESAMLVLINQTKGKASTNSAKSMIRRNRFDSDDDSGDDDSDLL